MWSRTRILGGIALTLAVAASRVEAGGAWVPAKGEGDLQLGYSVKTADSSWTARGDSVDNAS